MFIVANSHFQLMMNITYRVFIEKPGFDLGNFFVAVNPFFFSFSFLEAKNIYFSSESLRNPFFKSISIDFHCFKPDTKKERDLKKKKTTI